MNTGRIVFLTWKGNGIIVSSDENPERIPFTGENLCIPLMEAIGERVCFDTQTSLTGKVTPLRIRKTIVRRECA